MPKPTSGLLGAPLLGAGEADEDAAPSAAGAAGASSGASSRRQPRITVPAGLGVVADSGLAVWLASAAAAMAVEVAPSFCDHSPSDGANSGTSRLEAGCIGGGGSCTVGMTTSGAAAGSAGATGAGATGSGCDHARTTGAEGVTLTPVASLRLPEPGAEASLLDAGRGGGEEPVAVAMVTPSLRANAVAWRRTGVGPGLAASAAGGANDAVAARRVAVTAAAGANGANGDGTGAEAEPSPPEAMPAGGDRLPGESGDRGDVGGDVGHGHGRGPPLATGCRNGTGRRGVGGESDTGERGLLGPEVSDSRKTCG